YAIYAEQNHPLAKLWEVEDIEVPKLLEGSTIYPKEDIITVHTVDFSKVDDLLALPQIPVNPYKILYQSRKFHEFDAINNSEFIKATEPYNPKIIYSPLAPQNITRLRRDINSRNLNIKLLSGDGLFNNGLLSDSPSDLLIGSMVYHMTVPYDFGIIDFVGKDVVPTFPDLIITDMPARSGDSGGTVLSFVSPQNLNSVVIQGIIFGGGKLLHAAQLIDIIFKELRENARYDLTLYTG
ncbi:46049_t:CDS:2, partial [Gigaspora margarita]